jgi:hypothetical protein
METRALYSHAVHRRASVQRKPFSPEAAFLHRLVSVTNPADVPLRQVASQLLK